MESLLPIVKTSKFKTPNPESDAQYPNEHTLRAFQDNPDDTEESQITFVSALTASAFGLAAPAA